jgi:hypothetical protein
MSSIVILKNISNNRYFKLDLATLTTTIGYTSLDNLTKDNHYPAKFHMSNLNGTHLFTVDNIRAETYLKTNHPELFI